MAKEEQFDSGLISVIMPCFNAQAFLREAIDCVLSQTYGNVELVVVDDGSTDRSNEILEGYGARIVVHRQRNMGPYAARNTGLRIAKGQFIAFLDADDFWSRDFLEKLCAELSQSDADLAYCGWQNIGASDRSADPYVPPDYEVGSKLESFLQGASPWPIHAALVRRSAIDTVGPFDESLSSCMDYDLWLRLGVSRRVVRVPEVLAFYRFHGTGQITSKEWLQARNVWLVKKNFVRNHPALASRLSRRRLRELIDGGLASRAYRAYWRRDLVSSRKIFRMLLGTGYWTLKDVRYLLPALLPEGAYMRLIKLADRSQR
jgi:glycosyltransferase involved in cell wall biosynthesis